VTPQIFYSEVSKFLHRVQFKAAVVSVTPLSDIVAAGNDVQYRWKLWSGRRFGLI